MAKPEKDSLSVTARIHTEILADIDKHVEIRQKEKKGQTYNRTDAINEMLPLGLKALQNPKALDVGIIVLKHIDKLNDPQWVSDMKKRLEEINEVDYVAGLSQEKLDALAAIYFDELRIRAGKRPISLLDPEEKRKLLLK